MSPRAGDRLCVVLYCHLRFMAAGAKLTTSFARRGLIAGHGGTWMLRQLVGPMNAADILRSGRFVEAAEAERLGLVRTLPADNLLGDCATDCIGFRQSLLSAVYANYQTAANGGTPANLGRSHAARKSGGRNLLRNRRLQGKARPISSNNARCVSPVGGQRA